MHSVESSSNKPLSIPEPIPTPGGITNQAGSPLMSPNNTNAGRSDGENTIAMDFVVGNKGMQESNEDVKVSSEVQPNTTITTLASHQPTTIMSILVSISPVLDSICRPLAFISDSRPPLSWVQFLFHVPCAEFVALFVKPFKDIQNISMYEGFFAMDNSDDNQRGYYYLSLYDSVFRSTRFSIQIY